MAQTVLESAFTTTELPKAQSAAAEPLLSEDDCLSDAGSQFGLVSPERQASYVQPWQPSERGLAATHSLCLESMPRSASAPAGTAGQEEAIASTSQPSGLQQLLQRTRRRRKVDTAEAARVWGDQRHLLIAWLVLAVNILVSSMFWLAIGAVAGLLGVAGACLSLCNCCGGLELGTTVKATRVLALLTTLLSAVVVALCLIMLAFLACSPPDQTPHFCTILRLTLALVAVWHGLHGALAGLIVSRATHVARLLDPARAVLIVL